MEGAWFMAASRLITASRGLRSGYTSPFCAQAHFLALMSVGEQARGRVQSGRRQQADVMAVVVAGKVAPARRSPCIVLGLTVLLRMGASECEGLIL